MNSIYKQVALILFFKLFMSMSASFTGIKIPLTVKNLFLRIPRDIKTEKVGCHYPVVAELLDWFVERVV